MQMMDRRGFLRSVIGTAAVVAVATGAGVTLMTSDAEAAPVPADKTLPNALDDLVENAQYRYRHYRRRYHPHRYYWYRHHHRRRRRWTCWWHRGRRVCGWRYW